MAALCTVADRLQVTVEKLAVFSSVIIEVTDVNNTLAELIENDPALVEGFGAPDDPIIKFEIENFKQAVREAVISSKGVKSTIRSLAKFASNTDQIQRIKENLNLDLPHQDANYQELKSYLTVIGQRVSNCCKHMEKIQPMYKKVHNLVLKHNHPPLTTFAVPRFSVRRILKASAGPMGMIALTVLCPVLIKCIQHVQSFDYQQRMGPGICLSPFIRQTTYHMCEAASVPSPKWNPAGKPASVRMCILGILCLGCGIICLGCFFLVRALRSYWQVEERMISQPLAPPTTTIVSAGVAVSGLLEKTENYKNQLHDLEQCVGKAVNCSDSGSIGEIEVHLHKLQKDMEAIMALASDAA